MWLPGRKDHDDRISFVNSLACTFFFFFNSRSLHSSFTFGCCASWSIRRVSYFCNHIKSLHGNTKYFADLCWKVFWNVFITLWFVELFANLYFHWLMFEAWQRLGSRYGRETTSQSLRGMQQCSGWHDKPMGQTKWLVVSSFFSYKLYTFIY